MDDFEEKLERILGNPKAMAQILSLAQSIGGAPENPGSQPDPPAEPTLPEGLGALDPQMLSGMLRLLNQSRDGEHQQVALLQALRPFVREQRCAKLDKAIQIARFSRLIRMALELFRTEEDSHV